MSKIDPVHDLVLLVRSGHQLLHIDTEEEERVSALLLHVADRVDQPLFAWTRVRRLGRVDLPGTVYDTETPARRPFVTSRRPIGLDSTTSRISRHI